jgi:FdhE protein
MSKAGAPRHDPIPIGDIAAPPFVRLADPTTHFAARAARFRALAERSDLGPYLGFLAALSDCQHAVQEHLPEPAMPAQEVRERARAHAMPPLDRNRLTRDPILDATIDQVLARADRIAMPPAARGALLQVRGADQAGRDAMVRAVLAQAVPTDALADHVFVAAAVHVHLARTAARLDDASLVPLGDGVCPVCGGAPVASTIVGWRGAQNARFCACSLCGSLWHVVRIKCVLCGTTEGITYHEVEGGGDAVRAETCEGCRGYLKILSQHVDPTLDPVADDVASLGLDLLLRADGYRRGGVNVFLLGY